ncbi:PTS sugar transporter subunit IIA [uncultured Dubosiella sp.]|uniref:PTS sugar transporter subunit IIA n=1 Tax=uncultured Dubosiella sp. TaxID=1937011 RepID=UPI0026188EF3|nr:PTS sugar transporter subunit IIA [uncultured Dubosiella sp.]
MALFKRRKKEEKKPQILKLENIRIGQHVKTSDEAICSIGQLLVEAGYVEAPYIQGMLNRDHNLSVYIGNDIAIPHGEYEVKDYVKKTGLAVDIYPEGITWGEGNTVRIVIGIAATTDEHVTILQNIAEKLGDMDMVEKVVNGTPEFILSVLAGDAQ